MNNSIRRWWKESNDDGQIDWKEMNPFSRHRRRYSVSNFLSIIFHVNKSKFPFEYSTFSEMDLLISFREFVDSMPRHITYKSIFWTLRLSTIFLLLVELWKTSFILSLSQPNVSRRFSRRSIFGDDSNPTRRKSEKITVLCENSIIFQLDEDSVSGATQTMQNKNKQIINKQFECN